MAQMSMKNFALSPAAMDLGLGDQVTQKLQDDDEERKKNLLRIAAMNAQNQQQQSSLMPMSAVAKLGIGQI